MSDRLENPPSGAPPQAPPSDQLAITQNPAYPDGIPAISPFGYGRGSPYPPQQLPTVPAYSTKPGISSVPPGTPASIVNAPRTPNWHPENESGTESNEGPSNGGPPIAPGQPQDEDKKQGTSKEVKKATPNLF